MHHTVQANDYAAADVPAMIRADYAYHVRTRGWGDLGYNLVADRFGRLWEGRAGGIGAPVVGAHAQGFNTATLGVALLGDFGRVAPSSPALTALARVGAFAGARYRWDPRASAVLTSRGSPRYAAGQRVRLPRVFGHRQTGLTACPGQRLYDRLPTVRERAAALIGPPVRFVSARVTGVPLRAPAEAVVRVGLSRYARWAVSVRDPWGNVVATAGGHGTSAVLRWDGLVPLGGTGLGVPAVAGRYTWLASADDDIHTPPRPLGGAFSVGAPDPAAAAGAAVNPPSGHS